MDGQYPIRTAARLTSLSLDTLRAWERRYQAVTPERTDRGRLYSKANIAKLLLLRKLVEQGFAIGQIAAMEPNQLETLLSSRADTAATPSAPAPQVQHLADLFNAFDDIRAGTELNRLAILTPPRDLVINILLPLMRETGERWHKGQMAIAQEHMVSAAMHNVLGSLLRTHPPRQTAPRMLLATVAGDLHDFGILAAAMIAATTGWAPLYLGPNLPVSEIAGTARTIKSAVVVIGNSGQRTPSVAIRELASLLPPDVALWLGGPAPEATDGALPASVLLIPDMEQFESICLEAIR